VKAGVIHKIVHSSGNGVPIGAEMKPDQFKANFLDIGLTQAMLGLDVSPWILDPLNTLINKGEIAESFVGQELKAYGNPEKKNALFYWAREVRSSSREIDYLIQRDQNVIPIEVKSGTTGSLRSLHFYLESLLYKQNCFLRTF